MKLFKIENKIGTYWVVAKNFTEADEKLLFILNKNDYGYSEERKAITITVIAEIIENDFLIGKYLVL